MPPAAPVIDHRFTNPDLRPVGDWTPARYTPSLTGDESFTTDADRLLPVIARVWRSEDLGPNGRLTLDVWQVWLLRHILETYPPDWPVERLRGQLRYRQVVVSVARQNGKSLLGAILAFYLLTMHRRGPRVVGLASVDRQAKIVYDRVKFAVDTNPELAAVIKTTKKAGISPRAGGGIYQTLPAKEDSAQGEPISGALYDELHLGNLGLWDAIKKGQRAQLHSLLAGLTTAGDDDSLLLKYLYQLGDAAIEYGLECLAAGDWPAGDDERFGFFVWEASSDELTEANIVAASPAVACGRVDLATVMADARTEWKAPKDETGVVGKDRVIRYALNRFVEGSANTWASLPGWKACRADTIEQDPAGVVFALERTDAWEWLTITANSRPAGRLVTEVVATLPNVDHDLALEVCKHLGARPGTAFAMDRTTLAELGKALRDEGYEVWLLTAGEMAEAAAGASAAITRRALSHPGDSLLSLQMPTTRRRDLTESWRVSRSLSVGDTDAVIATIAGLHVAATRTVHVRQMF